MRSVIIPNGDFRYGQRLCDGSRVVFRPLRKSDTNRLYHMFSTLSKRSRRFLGSGFSRKDIESWTTFNNDAKILPIVVVPRTEPTRIIGYATLRFSSTISRMHVGQLGIIVNDQFQGRGLGTSLVSYVLAIARKRGLKKICLRVDTRNTRAIRLFLNCRFEIEATLARETLRGKRYGNEYLMSLFL
jgi:RimJ/RimL family protein N-acetyltransferase